VAKRSGANNVDTSFIVYCFVEEFSKCSHLKGLSAAGSFVGNSCARHDGCHHWTAEELGEGDTC